MRRPWRSAFFALVLIACGVLLLVDQFTSYKIAWKAWWPLILIIFGLFNHIQFFAEGRRDQEQLTSGGVLLVYGGMVLYCSLNGWGWMNHLWPLFILGPALGLLEAKIAHYRGRSWIPIFVLLVIGGSFLAREFTDWSWMASVGIGLIIIGIGMTLGLLFRKKDPPNP